MGVTLNIPASSFSYSLPAAKEAFRKSADKAMHDFANLSLVAQSIRHNLDSEGRTGTEWSRISVLEMKADIIAKEARAILERLNEVQ